MKINNLFNNHIFNKNIYFKNLLKLNKILHKLSATERITWALNNLFSNFVLTSSFGVQSAVLLHLMTTQKPKIPVILIDTGYLFPETYKFIDILHSRLCLNLHVFNANISSSWQKVRYGELWNMGLEGINLYNNINKIQPMNKSFSKFSVRTWFAGLRIQQSSTRAKLSYLSLQKNIFKFLPILDWSNLHIHKYLKKHNLPYHPLWDKGYVSVGDVHTTRKYIPGESEENTRFFGLKRECGLHDLI
ncbi:phosphoadenylyl-sulfate reductase [Buchnera aphidicola (Mollitrichosiphum nigrofasciatum)]|uniref:phosphoadenylyl-sulfate reductase n=1 Tax=Buchnera aphidicola TaxID=9 RepID=UPI0031B8457E